MNDTSQQPSKRRRIQSHILIATAILATLIAIFYLEEDWRGKRAWDKCRQELEAKGAILEWDKSIPPPVPDDQNFFTASTNILIRFVKARIGQETAAATNLTWLAPNYNGFPEQIFSKTNSPVVAELTLVAPGTSVTDGLRLKLDDADASNHIASTLSKAIGRYVIGATGRNFSEHDLSHLTPMQIFVETSGFLSADDLKRIVPADLATNIGQLTVTPTADRTKFTLVFSSGRVTTAAEYLRWSDRFTPALDEVREALKRPYALIPGDFSEPSTIPIPNFVMMRWIAQLLAQRTQCHILLGEPEKALPDLTLMHDVCRILEHRPTRQPMTLVEAMINVAITGLYTDTVREGLNAQVWKEPELMTLQAQFKEVDLGPNIYKAFRFEQAATVRLGERANFEKLLTLGVFDDETHTPWCQKIWQHTEYTLFPQGWVDQNVRVAAELHQNMLDALEESSTHVAPRKIDSAMDTLLKTIDKRSVFHLLATIAVPNFTKALQTYSMNQTYANEGQIACALERYRLAHGEYPEKLDTLVPQFMTQVPTDLIGSQPLHYHRTVDGKFLLYSVGWNETDDGGQPTPTKNGSLDQKEGDWVWKN